MERRPLPGGGTAYVARSPGQRLLGLMGLRALAPGCVLLFPGCDSVHTAWMRVAIDVVFLDADGGVLAVRRSLRPWRVARCRGAAAVLECPAGGAEVLVSGRSSRAATGA
ncbi:MAG TPA: DUF192 domain-containing protein [Thermoleophilaceae bacterium]|nr:DUF192 domain-containing protein [Thermoleophilaceae bacterium]